jgi:NADH dehydrogenase
MPGPTSAKLVTVFGGSGFVGRYVVQALVKRGHRIRVAVRRPDLAGHVQPLGMVGQIKAIQANLRYRWSVDRAVEGADAVVNLVGILAEAGRQTFDAVQAFGPRAVGEAARAAGISNVVHVSAIGADQPSTIGYLRSKAEGEAGIHETVPDAVIMRPSIVFGPEDHFFNRFAAMARMSPALPLIGGGNTKFQPVYAGDLGEAIARAIDGDAQDGTIYELGGPEVLTFRQCMERMLEVTRRKRLLAPVPWFAARMLGRVGQHLPGAPITLDQVRMLRFDNVVSPDANRDKRTLEGLGIEPTALEIVLPTYLGRFRERGEFTQVRRAS